MGDLRFQIIKHEHGKKIFGNQYYSESRFDGVCRHIHRFNTLLLFI